MKQNYRKLGKYSFLDLIEEVSERNTKLEFGLSDIVGVTIEKGIIPTIANLTQTSLDKFYIVSPNTFIYNPRTHGVRLGMGYNDTTKTYITSWNNVAFRVKKSAKDIVLPEFLWIYFNRDEWDRQSNFLAWGSSTIVFAWNDFLNVKIKLPDLTEQQHIVNAYNTVDRRIRLLKQINEKLEATAQAIYRKMFVEDADDKWEVKKLGEIADLSAGGDKPDCFSEEKTDLCSIPIYSNGIENYGLYGFTDKPKITKEAVTVSARGTIGYPCLRLEPYFPIIRLVSVIPKEEITDAVYLYFFLKNANIVSSGTTQQQLTVPEFSETKVIVPTLVSVMKFSTEVRKIITQIRRNELEVSKLQNLKQLIISRISGM